MLDAVVTDTTLTPEDSEHPSGAGAAQSFITASFRQTSLLGHSLGSELRFSYDAESPMTRLDVGGDDQEHRHAHI